MQRIPARTFRDLILIADLKYGDASEINEQLEEVSRLLTAYTNAVASNF